MATAKKKDETTTILLLGLGALLLYSMTKKAPAQVPITATNNAIVPAETILPGETVAPVAERQPADEVFTDFNKPAGYTPMMVEPELVFPKPTVFPNKYPDELVFLPYGGYGGLNPVKEKYQDVTPE